MFYFAAVIVVLTALAVGSGSLGASALALGQLLLVGFLVLTGLAMMFGREPDETRPLPRMRRRRTRAAHEGAHV